MNIYYCSYYNIYYNVLTWDNNRYHDNFIMEEHKTLHRVIIN